MPFFTTNPGTSDFDNSATYERVKIIANVQRSSLSYPGIHLLWSDHRRSKSRAQSFDPHLRCETNWDQRQTGSYKECSEVSSTGLESTSGGRDQCHYAKIDLALTRVSTDESSMLADRGWVSNIEPYWNICVTVNRSQRYETSSHHIYALFEITIENIKPSIIIPREVCPGRGGQRSQFTHSWKWIRAQQLSNGRTFEQVQKHSPIFLVEEVS